MQGFGTTIFAEMSALALATGSVNLGQGFPDTDGPAEVLETAQRAIRAGRNQYPPLAGTPELLEAVAAHQRHWYGLAYDPHREILVTAGATEALAASVLGLCEIGDEVVLFEPYYDAYAACIALSGATHRVVRLREPDWSFDPAELERAVTSRTRLLLLNSPNNPTGKVFTTSELEAIARVCVERDLIAVTDEVYEHLIFEGAHVPLATFPGMRERTVTISSAAKTFSVTGWKVGWACADEGILSAVRTAKQFLTYVNAAPLQPAVAAGLSLSDAWFKELAAALATRRDQLRDGLEHLGFSVLPSHGTYFLTTDIRPLGVFDGAAFCRSLPHRCGVVAIPSSVFYDDTQRGSPFVRWTFCKRAEVLDEALERLAAITRGA
jgi:N-succinyldiaminopimelate aminotransferase